jgi:hypothetical protein
MLDLLTKFFNVSHKKDISVHFTTFTIILAMTVLFLLPALDNGFPFWYPDASEYVGGYGLTHVNPSRSIYYILFTRIFDVPILVPSTTSWTPWNVKGWSPWPSVVLQSLITAWVIWRFASALFNLNTAFPLVLLALLLVFGTSLPWFVGQIMPDIFTSLMILALALLCFPPDNLSRVTRILLILLVGAAVMFHQANLPVALWTLPGLGLCAFLGWRPSKPFRRSLFASGIGLLTLGVVALVAANLASGRFGFSGNGSVFLLARFIEDGTALSYLEKACPQRRFSVCAYLDELRSYRPIMRVIPGCPAFHTSRGAHFLFEGPLDKLGGWRAEEAEASAIVAGTFLTDPLTQFRASANDGLRLLFSFDIGDGLCAYPEELWAIDSVFGPVVYAHYRRSKQIRNALLDRLDLLNYIQAAVLVASALVLIGFLVRGPRERPRAFFPSLSVIVLVVGNAFTLGALSGPDTRYQSRVIWLVPLLAACVLLEHLPAPGYRKRNAYCA